MLSGEKADERGRAPTSNTAATSSASVSMTETWLSFSDVMYTHRPSGLRVTPSGSPPTGSWARISPLAMSTMLASAASSLATKIRVPSALTATCSGSVPAFSTFTTRPSAMSTMPMPSAERSGGGNVDSSTPGGAGGDPLRATNRRSPAGSTLMPRGRLPSGMVSSTSWEPPAITDKSPDVSLVTKTRYGGGGGASSAGGSGAGSGPPQAFSSSRGTASARMSKVLMTVLLTTTRPGRGRPPRRPCAAARRPSPLRWRLP